MIKKAANAGIVATFAAIAFVGGGFAMQKYSAHQRQPPVMPIYDALAGCTHGGKIPVDPACIEKEAEYKQEVTENWFTPVRGLSDAELRTIYAKCMRLFDDTQQYLLLGGCIDTQPILALRAKQQ